MKKTIAAIILVLTLGIFSGCALGGYAESTGNAPYGYEVLTGCWVGESEGLVGAVQFFSDGTYVMKASIGYRTQTTSGTYYTEKDGTIKMGATLNDSNVGTYELSENTLILTLGEDEVMRFTRFEKNINHVDFKLKTSSGEAPSRYE